jgi:hypothetical protein
MYRVARMVDPGVRVFESDMIQQLGSVASRKRGRDE